MINGSATGDTPDNGYPFLFYKLSIDLPVCGLMFTDNHCRVINTQYQKIILPVMKKVFFRSKVKKGIIRFEDDT
jgi:hypothetical protein